MNLNYFGRACSGGCCARKNLSMFFDLQWRERERTCLGMYCIYNWVAFVAIAAGDDGSGVVVFVQTSTVGSVVRSWQCYWGKFIALINNFRAGAILYPDCY